MISVFYQVAADEPFLPIFFSGRHPIPCTDPNNLVYAHRGVLAGKYRLNPDNKRQQRKATYVIHSFNHFVLSKTYVLSVVCTY